MCNQCIMIINSRMYVGVVSLTERIFLWRALLHVGFVSYWHILYQQMKRKRVGIRQVYDARALRVIVGDKNGALHGPAVRSCYSILDIVHRFPVNLIIYVELPMSRRSRYAKVATWPNKCFIWCIGVASSYFRVTWPFYHYGCSLWLV